MDCCAGAAPALYICRSRAAVADSRPDRDYRTPTDIFPNIDIPVVSILWNYAGLNAQDLSSRIVTLNERVLTTTVDDVEHSESQSLNGIAVVKVFFQPHANIEKAIAQITAICQTQLRQLPPGTTPPLIITYNASTVPILQLALSGQKLSEQQLFDYGVNFIRTRLVTVAGAAIPYPYGGKLPQVQVDLDTNALQAKGLSPADVVNAISVQNLILPSGTAKIGQFEYDVDLNGSPKTVAGAMPSPNKPGQPTMSPWQVIARPSSLPFRRWKTVWRSHSSFPPIATRAA